VKPVLTTGGSALEQRGIGSKGLGSLVLGFYLFSFKFYKVNVMSNGLISRYSYHIFTGIAYIKKVSTQGHCLVIYSILNWRFFF
jgi:hypothetical protein